MKYLASTMMVAAAVALAATSVSRALPQGVDIEAGTHLTMKECLAMQAAKNDGASRAELKKACQWTLDADGTDRPSAGVRNRAIIPVPYATAPGAMDPPAAGH